MPLEVRDFRARQKDVLSGTSSCLFLLDLELHNHGGVLDNFRDVCAVARADFTENTLPDPDNSTDEPVTL